MERCKLRKSDPSFGCKGLKCLWICEKGDNKGSLNGIWTVPSRALCSAKSVFVVSIRIPAFKSSVVTLSLELVDVSRFGDVIRRLVDGGLFRKPLTPHFASVYSF